MKIVIRRTHYELIGYTIGSRIELEDLFSIWIDPSFSRKYYYHYDEDTQTLYLPRGLDINYITQQFPDTEIEYDDSFIKPTNATFQMKMQPRDMSQREAIRFILGKDEYEYTRNQSQLVLSLPGGGGKTYCLVAALSLLKVNAIIIAHTVNIRDQWIDRILEYTDLPKSRIKVLDSGTEANDIVTGKLKRMSSTYSIFVCTHRTLFSFMKRFGFHSLEKLFTKLGIGIKVVDEAHLEFSDSLMLDYAANVWKTFYLTATFGKSNYKENTIYQRSFGSVYKLKKTDSQMGRSRNVIAITYLIRSGISMVEERAMFNRRQFNVHKYFACEMEYGKIYEAVRYWLNWFYNIQGFTGRTFILSSKIASCDECDRIAKNMFPDKRCTTHHSKHKVEDLTQYDILSATDRMLGTGIDLDNVGMIINLVPISSSVNIDQITHRLMRGVEMDTAFLVDVVDESVTHTLKMYERRSKTIRKIVKKSLVLREEI